MIESITFETVTLKPSSTSVVEAGSTVEDVPVSPVLEEALTVKLGKSWQNLLNLHQPLLM